LKRYITQAEVDLLPLEPRARFVAIYELVNDRFENELAKIDPQNEWHLIDSARVRFAAAMMGFAHSLGIGEVADVSPSYSRWC
jgi:Xaa-Pro aminopeptidase